MTGFCGGAVGYQRPSSDSKRNFQPRPALSGFTVVRRKNQMDSPTPVWTATGAGAPAAAAGAGTEGGATAVAFMSRASTAVTSSVEERATTAPGVLSIFCIL